MAGTVVICFTDIVGSTALLTRVGDDAFDTLRRTHFDLLARQVDAHGGSIVKNLGDGIMATFGSASDAVSAAVDMQRSAHAAARSAGADGIAIRVGVSAGDASLEDGDWFGAPVVEGARLCAAAESGQILVSEVVRLLAGARGGHELLPLGELELKGLAGPVSVSEVHWTPADAAVAVPLPGPLAATEGELPFSGRRSANEVVRTAWKAAAGGQPHIVLIGGEPGVGKTRLVSELARAVHAGGAVVLLGRSDEHIDAPFGPWREAVRRLVQGLPDEAIAAHVAEFGGELGRLVPNLAGRSDGAPAPIETDAETERLLLFEAVGGLLAAASNEAPLLLVLDDLHWADRPSLLLLLHLLRMDHPASLLVLATYRDTDVDRSHPLSTVLADLRRVPTATRLALGGLDGDGIAELLTSTGGHDLDEEARAFATTLWRETEGNPFFVGEVLRHLVESGALVQRDGRWRASATLSEAGLPEGVRDVIGRRLAALPADTDRLLGIAAIVGREFDPSVVAAVARVATAEVFDALAAAEDARLVEAVPDRAGRYTFAHALVRTTLAEELGTTRRIQLHRAVGLVLEEVDEPPIGELAFHFGECAVLGEVERAARYAREAAEQALALAAPDEAAAIADRALRALGSVDGGGAQRAALRLVLAMAENALGSAEALETAATAFQEALAAGDPALTAVAAIEYGGPVIFYLDPRGEEQLRTALDLLDPRDSELRSKLLTRLGLTLAFGPGDDGARLAREGFDMAVRVGSRPAQQIAANALAATLRSVDRQGQLEFARLALELRESRMTGADFDPYGHLFEALASMGDLAGLQAAIVSMSEDFASSGMEGVSSATAWYWTITHQARVSLALIGGRFDEVETILRALRAELAPTDSSGAIGNDEIGLRLVEEFDRAQLAHHRGEWEAALVAWERTKALLPGVFDTYFGYAANGADLASLRRHWDSWRAADPQRPTITRPANSVALADALRRLREPEASAAYGEEFAAHAGYFVTNSVMYFNGPYDTAIGVFFTTAGQYHRAVTHLEQAVEQCAAIESPVFGAIAQLELATTLLLRGRPEDEARAAALRDESGRITAALNMHGWHDRVERLRAGDLEPWRLEA